MDATRWKRLNELFDAAIDLAVEERRRFVDEACADDESLRERLHAMLDEDATAHGTIEQAVGLAVRAVTPGDDASERRDLAGSAIGPYRVVRELGHGGMGSVWLAVRDDDEYRKEVAIKLMHRGLERPGMLQRFRAERQILAGLEHPNIARMLDGGTTADGQPYVVMEHVEGREIAAYCDERRLTTDERLRLFRRVCSAVHYAHRNLVVHRDIKPGNILVTDAGEPKLLDFGIAKLLDPSAPEADVAETRTVGRLLTPEYASPEQVRGESITTASDVYSLGVLLYELLTGHRPYRLKSHRAHELERAICESNPERPSTAVTHDSDTGTGTGTGTDADRATTTAASIGKARRTDPDRLRRRLSGDLDNMCLMALRKEPERRYASAEQFGIDVDRHLEGLPVIARPATFGYRAGKFVSRNAWAVTAATVTVVVIAGLVGFYTVQLRAERDRARLESARVARVSDFLVEIFAGADPFHARGAELTARQMLDRGAARIEAELAEEPAVQATLLVVMGDAYERLGAWDEAQPLFERSLAIRRELHGGPHDEIAESLDKLSWLLRSKGESKASAERIEESLAMHRTLHAGDHEGTALALHNLALSHDDRGEVEQAEALYLEAIEMRRRLDSPDLGLSLNNLGTVMQRRGDVERGNVLFSEAVDSIRRNRDEDHPEIAALLNNWGNLKITAGDLEGALELHEEALAIRQRVLDATHGDIGASLMNLSVVYGRLGDLERASQIQVQAVELFRVAVGEDHPRYVFARSNMGDTLMRLERYDEAETIYIDTLEFCRKRFGERHHEVGHSLSDLGGLRSEQGNHGAAAERFAEAAEIYAEAFGVEASGAVRNRLRHANELVALERFDEAERKLEADVAMLRETDQTGNLGLALVNLGGSHMKRHDAAGAERYLREAYRLEQEAPGASRLNTAQAETRLGECLADLGQYDEAEALLLTARDELIAANGEDDDKVAHVLSALEQLATERSAAQR